MAESIKVLVPEEEVDARIRALGEQISKDYEGKQDRKSTRLNSSHSH